MSGYRLMEGPLSKWTNLMKGWQYRWFVLDDNMGILSYYISREKRMRGERRGCIRLQGAVIGIDDEDDSTFTITVDQKTFHFQAKHADEKEQWIQYLESSISKLSQPSLTNMSQQPSFQQLETCMVNFDRKLAEADSYLKILIQQVQDLDSRINACGDEASTTHLKAIKSSAEIMIESIKQTIVFLQISKHNIVHMNNGLLQQQKLQQKQLLSLSKHNYVDIVTNDNINISIGNLKSSKDGGIESVTHRSAECLVDTQQEAQALRQTDLQKNIITTIPPTTTNTSQLHPIILDSIPNMSNSLPNLLAPLADFGADSFSSSDDDDDHYYDAEDVTIYEANKSRSVAKLPTCSNNNTTNIYDEDEDEDSGTDLMENHGNLITHLLSQLHIGMDLTKVTLPTFILEKRSLLEMYSDFLSHPDIFVGIVDEQSPKERLVQTVKWYLTAFHAGKKSGVAKKPYNPILGECFKCFYDLSGVSKNKTEDSSVVDSNSSYATTYCPLPTEADVDLQGPIPWCSKRNLAFIAEQVSHHPPISAFYSECHNKRISINGYIWTKSKFLGLSVGVHMIGQAVISLLGHEEEYVVTFPNGYGRSILTVPWMELGGKVSISCAKTGYYANIEFLTKPFYGGKKDQVVAEMFGPLEKKAFASIKGEWNGVMNIKKGNVSEVFLDTKNMPVIKKQVKAIEKQESYESRKLWRNVTVNLKERNIEKATDFKCQLEQKQREEARVRKEKAEKYNTLFFHEVGEHWVFDRPLVKRINNL